MSSSSPIEEAAAARAASDTKAASTPVEQAEELDWRNEYLSAVKDNSELAGALSRERASQTWRSIESAPRDGTLFVGCNLEHPSFGAWAMYRRVQHAFTDDGEVITTDLGGWVLIHDLHPDFREGFATGPEPETAVAPDHLNTSVRYGWRPLPEPAPRAAPAEAEGTPPATPAPLNAQPSPGMNQKPSPIINTVPSTS